MDIGIDIGGSHIGVGIISPDGKIVKRQERYLKYNRRLNLKEYIVNEIVFILKKWEDNKVVEVKRIGIGVPGIVKDGKIIYSANLGISDFNLADEIKKHFPNAEIKMMNDAKSAALAEKKWGSIKKYDDCVFLCLGTGIGGAAFFNGKMISPNRCAGFEFGHMVISKNGIPCKCGSKGCFEQYGSMRKFKNKMRASLNVERSVDGNDLLRLVKRNIHTEAVSRTIDEYIKHLCIGIANIVNILEPQAICIGGGFVKYRGILLKRLEAEFAKSKNVFYKDELPKIVTAELGNDAGMIGSVLGFE